jgi:hypothetical protein
MSCLNFLTKCVEFTAVKKASSALNLSIGGAIRFIFTFLQKKKMRSDDTTSKKLDFDTVV